MSIKFNKENLKRSHQGLVIVIDMFMLLLISFNLLWLVFDSFFASPLVQAMVKGLSERFFIFYTEQVHPNFMVYDLFFVAIYLFELVVRWVISVIQKEYYRWWFFPFVHWYDVLGSLPISAFRFLRLLRIVSIVYRLQKYNIIDFSETFLFRFMRKYAGVLVEEVADRVVINVLEGVQKEIEQGNPITHRTVHEVIKPRQKVLAQWLGDRITDVIDRSYKSRRLEVVAYVQKLIFTAMSQNTEMGRLSKLPGIGPKIADQLESAVSNISFGVVDQIAHDLHSDDSTGLIHEAMEVIMMAITEREGEMSVLIQQVLLESIELIKEEVRVQKWKDEEGLP